MAATTIQRCAKDLSIVHEDGCTRFGQKCRRCSSAGMDNASLAICRRGRLSQLTLPDTHPDNLRMNAKPAFHLVRVRPCAHLRAVWHVSFVARGVSV